MLYGGLQVLGGSLTLGDLMMFLVYLAMLLEPLAMLASSVTSFQSQLAGFDRVLDLLNEPLEMAANPGTLRIRKADVAGRVTLNGVGFTYPGGDRPVLSEIDLDVEPGETIALVGRSGSGKTTLTNLIARFYDPTEGTILLDGMDLRTIEVESYRRLLGIVEQDVFLFDGTVAENIAYAARAGHARGHHPRRAASPTRPGSSRPSPTAMTPSSASAACASAAASASGSPSPAPCSPTRGSSSWTRPPATSTARANA